MKSVTDLRDPSALHKKLLRRCRVEDSTGCWIFRGAGTKDRYGIIHGEGRSFLAHRAMFELAKGPLVVRDGDKKLLVLHRCDTPACCNPDHLYLGTSEDNANDMAERCRCRNGYWRQGKEREQKRFGRVYWTIRGETRPLRSWAQRFGVSEQALDGRLRAGWSAEDLRLKKADRSRVLHGKEEHTRHSGNPEKVKATRAATLMAFDEPQLSKKGSGNEYAIEF